MEGIKKISSVSKKKVSFFQQNLWVHTSGNTDSNVSRRRHFFVQKQILTHFFSESDRVLATSVFSTYSWNRDDRENTHVQYDVSLFVFDVVFDERSTTVELEVYALTLKSP